MSDSVRDSIVVAAEPDAVMDVISDFEAYPDWQQEMKQVDVLETDGRGRGTRVRFLVDAKVLRTSVVLAYTYTDRRMAWTLVEGDQIRRNDGSYTLEDLGDGTTRVTYELEIEPAIPLPGMVRRRAAKRLVDAALPAMKRRVEQAG